MGILQSLLRCCFKGKADKDAAKAADGGYKKVQTDDADPELGAAALSVSPKRAAVGGGGVSGGGSGGGGDNFTGFSSWDAAKKDGAPKPVPASVPLVPPRSATPKAFAPAAPAHAPAPYVAPAAPVVPAIPAPAPATPILTAATPSAAVIGAAVSAAANMGSNAASQSLVTADLGLTGMGGAVEVAGPAAVDSTSLFGDLEPARKKAPAKEEPKIDFFSNLGMAPVVVEPVRKKVLPATAAYAPTLPAAAATAESAFAPAPAAAVVTPASVGAAAAAAAASSLSALSAADAPVASSGAFSMDAMLDRSSVGAAGDAWGGDGDLDLGLGDLGADAGAADAGAAKGKKKGVKPKAKKPKGLGATVVDDF